MCQLREQFGLALELPDGIAGLVKNMRSEQQLMRDWVEAQANEQKQMRITLDKLAEALRQQQEKN